MTLTLSAVATVTTTATIKSSGLGTITGRQQIDYQRKLQSTDVTKIYAAQRTASGADSLDVTSLTDPLGNPVVFSSVLAIHVLNTDATHAVTVSGNLIGTDTVTVGPGKTLYIDTTRTVDGSHHVLTVTPASGTVAYDIIILGS